MDKIDQVGLIVLMITKFSVPSWYIPKSSDRIICYENASTLITFFFPLCIHMFSVVLTNLPICLGHIIRVPTEQGRIEKS